MDNSQVNNKRIAKNAIVLYMRMLLMMAITFYASRVILKVLGVEDFGIYNVVWGVTTIVTFFSGSLMNIAQRYLNIGIGANDLKLTNHYFNQFLMMFSVLSVVVLLIGELASVWVIERLLSIPPDRIIAAHWVYQFSLFSLILTLLQTPFQAAVIANEKMQIFAYITLNESISKLVILYLVDALFGDNLVQYAGLLFMITVVVLVSYSLYCIKNFKECKIRPFFDKKLAKEMYSFMGYNIYGCFAFSMCQQGVNVLLNIFFGPAINAARAIAIQVNQGVYKFSDNILVAVRPPIIKLYAQKDFTSMIDMSINTTRFCLFINTLLVLPIIYNSDYILKLWLGNVPAYTSVFIIIILIESFFNIMNQMITILVNATGNLKRNQFYGRTFTLLVLPLSYWLLLWKKDPSIPVMATLIGTMLYFLNNLYDVHRQLGVDVVRYLKKTILPTIALVLPLSVVCIIITRNTGQNLAALALSIITVFILGCILVYAFLITSYERRAVINIVKYKIFKK